MLLKTQHCDALFASPLRTGVPLPLDIEASRSKGC